MKKRNVAVALSVALALTGAAPAVSVKAEEQQEGIAVVAEDTTEAATEAEVATEEEAAETEVTTETTEDDTSTEAIPGATAVAEYAADGDETDVQEENMVEINETNFPDEVFRNYLTTTFDTDGDGMIDVTQVKRIDTSVYYPYTDPKVASFKGIELFTELTALMCSNNDVTSIDLSKNTKLMNLMVTGNKLTELDVSANTGLFSLYCGDNEISSLDVSGLTRLINLECQGNNLKSLKLKNNTALKALDCSYNFLADEDFSYLDASAMRKFVTSPQKIQVALDETNIPDANFRKYLSDNFDADKDGFILNNDVEELYVEGYDIRSLKGIEFFTELTTLSCANNLLTELDVSKNTKLMNLYCNNNMLTELDLKNNKELSILSCYNNYLKDVDFSYLDLELEYCTLTPQYSAESLITLNQENFPDETFRKYLANSFDTNNTGKIMVDDVTKLSVDNLGIKSLKGVELLTNVTYLSCDGNGLTDLDVSKNTALTILSCADNKLEKLDLANNTKLQRLYCYSNSLSQLDVTGLTDLVALSCAFNKLTALDVSKNVKLTELICFNNKIATLDVGSNLSLIHI